LYSYAPETLLCGFRVQDVMSAYEKVCDHLAYFAIYVLFEATLNTSFIIDPSASITFVSHEKYPMNVCHILLGISILFS
jgi:hypothetical protein